MENDKMRDVFMAYFYCLIHCDFKDDNTITELDAFNKIEKEIYNIYYKKYKEEQLIDRITLTFDMQINNLLEKFNLILYSGDTNKWLPIHIKEYKNAILREYRINMFKEAKTENDIEKAIIKLDSLSDIADINCYDMKYGLDILLNNNSIRPLTTGLDVFDNKILLVGGLVGILGKSGSGKTSLLVELIKRILVIEYKLKEKKVSVLWNNMEDSIKMTVASMISQEVKIPAKYLRMGKYTKTDEENIKKLYNSLKMLDITFQDRQKYMHEIKKDWKQFLKRKKKEGTTYPILIIDNLMKLKDNGDKGNQTEKDDFIMDQISLCWDEAKKLYGDECMVIYLHHLSKEQMGKGNANECYKPNSSHIKGSSRIQDVSTTLIFVHRFFDFDDIRRDFNKMIDILPYISLITCTKNREGGWIGDCLLFSDLEYKFCNNYPENNESTL